MKIIDLHDRFGRSLVSGFIASLTLFALNMTSFYVIHFSHRRYLNWASILIFGRKLINLNEAIISSITQIFFSTSLIVIFSYIILKENSRNYIWRGLFVGLGNWFAIMSLGYVLGFVKIIPNDAPSTVSFMICSAIWGMLGAWLLHVLDDRYATLNEIQLEGKVKPCYRSVPSPAMKKKHD